MEDGTYTLREVSQELGIPTHNLRRFCDKGLIRGVRRKRGGYRILNESQVERAQMLENLRRIGFSYNDMKRFVRLEGKGDATILERKAMLETKRRQLWQQVEELQDGIDFVERKIEVFDKKLVGSER